MKKKLFVFIFTLLIESLLTYFVSVKLSIRFIEIMFFAGLIFSLTAFWYSSSGGAITRYIDTHTSAETGLLQKYQPLKFNRGLYLMPQSYSCPLA
ncbi:hypothetical protein RCG23_19735 [Neobacillus sp. PS3-34]|uniref:hypothetical protein n=1 Tax=Neobacillus sp. PS3-34 TaxID=3070678 RepID=UPI0027E1839E|nr:hypothetical protein [Neobacillus sp. PS3-34]WML47596.1 hypothetical protein RCG23_19735 [Neobacillus sp. PS3-34]